MDTIGEVLSRIRRGIKATTHEAFITDRYLYSLLMKHASVFMRRQDSTNKLLKFNAVFQTLDHYELISVPPSELPGGLGSAGEYMTRTRYELPTMHEGYFGPLLRDVTSLDQSVKLLPTYTDMYRNNKRRSDSRYNTSKYYYYLDNHLYFPDVDWKSVRIEGVFEGDIDHINNHKPFCKSFQDQRCNIPQFLMRETEDAIKQELGVLAQIPPDLAQDNISTLK